LFTVLIRVGITAVTVLTIYIIIQNVDTYKNSVTDPTLLLIVVGIVAFVISCFFVSMYSEAIESIYTTYIMDIDAGGSKDNAP
jgi:uncharacterized protein with PQ loop repeat